MNSALITALVICGIALCVTAIWAVIRLGRAADSVKKLADDLEVRTPALLDKADVTVDALNAELLRMDMIVTQVEEVTELVSSASSAVHTIVNTPYEVMSELSERLRRSLRAPRRPRASRVPDANAPEQTEEQQPAELPGYVPAVQDDQMDRQEERIG